MHFAQWVSVDCNERTFRPSDQVLHFMKIGPLVGFGNGSCLWAVRIKLNILLSALSMRAVFGGPV